ncbi:MAG: pilus assembly protein PilP [Gammaproteobacteria bacterium]
MSRQTRSRWLLRLGLVGPLAALLLAAGCGGGNKAGLHAWVARVNARPGAKLKPIPKLKPYQPYTYPLAGLRSPFVPVEAPKVSNIHPNLHRQKQYLERFPLDALKFVGEIKFGGTAYALIQDPQGVVHRVHAGNYMGQESGRITAILPNRIDLTEIVPNGDGGYLKQPATLALVGTNGG